MAKKQPKNMENRYSTALRRLVEAAEVYMTSDPMMPSHNEAEEELEIALDHAKSLLGIASEEED